ncbi:MAG: MBL fold metallo-hydrolase [Bacteroidota bacterium]
MSLAIASLNSGSNGNCYYIGNNSDAILIDAGLTCLDTETRMRRIGLKMDKVKAVFISHEHSDHIKGIEVLAKKYQLPVYITPKTYINGRLNIAENLVYPFTAANPVHIGSLQVLPFGKHHDAADPHSFVVSGNHINIGVFTDIGHCCDQVIHHFKQCHAIFLEANYDDEMLERGSYPYRLKQRIRGNKGHLSNAQALELFKQNRPRFMSHVLLSHLSRDNNHPQVALDMFEPFASGPTGSTEIYVASRYEESPVIMIDAEQRHKLQPFTAQARRPAKGGKAVASNQLSLF